jgi:hypothetical protein
MNEKSASPNAPKAVDPKIEQDWADVEARRNDISRREGGDTRRQAILRRIGYLKHTS